MTSRERERKRERERERDLMDLMETKQRPAISQETFLLVSFRKFGQQGPMAATAISKDLGAALTYIPGRIQQVDPSQDSRVYNHRSIRESIFGSAQCRV